MAEIDCFEKGKPNAVEVLGYKFVAWQDKQGDWHAARDVCPHRYVTVALRIGWPMDLLHSHALVAVGSLQHGATVVYISSE